jgi:hypothetical protein
MENRLHLENGFGPSVVGMGLIGTGLGLGNGMLIGNLARPKGVEGSDNDRALQGGALAGSALGLASGLVLSKFYAPDGKDLGTAVGTSVGAIGFPRGHPALLDGGAGGGRIQRRARASPGTRR